MLRFLVADDHPIVRRGLKEVLADGFSGATIQEAETGQAALAAVRAEDFNAMILDLNLPDKPGLEVLKETKALRPGLPVLILSLHPEEQYALRALKAGAAAYLTKERAPDELLLALRKVLEGGRYVTSTLAEQLAGAIAGEQPDQEHHKLSDRELEVLCLLGQGKSVTDIAEHLSLSVKTVSTYRSRLLEKLHLATTADLIRYAMNHRLVQ